MSNFKNNPKFKQEDSTPQESFVPYFLRSSRAADEPIGGRDYVIFPDSFPNIGMPLTGEEMLMVQGKLEEPEILTPNQIKYFFSGNVVADSQGFVTGDQVYKELLKYVPITRKINGYTLDKDINLTKADVGLGNVDNTSDKDKPVSDAQREELNKLDDRITTEITRLDNKDANLQQQINDLGTESDEIKSDIEAHKVDPNAHPEIVDQSMSDTSKKAIANKVVKNYIDTIINRQGSKTSIVATDEILVMDATGKYYRATIQKAVLDLVDSAIGDMGKVLHFVGVITSAADIPNINNEKDGAYLYVEKLSTPNTTITDPITSQVFTSCDVIMKDGSQWRIVGKTMWWVDLTYKADETNKKAVISNTAGTGFEIPVATDSNMGLYPKDHFKLVDDATETPTASQLAKYNTNGNLMSGKATSETEVLIYSQIDDILNLAKAGYNYSILDVANAIKGTYHGPSTPESGRALSGYWDYTKGLDNAYATGDNSLALNFSSTNTGDGSAGLEATVILKNNLVLKLKETKKIYCALDLSTLAVTLASLNVTIYDSKTRNKVGEWAPTSIENTALKQEIELDETWVSGLDSSVNNFIDISIKATPTEAIADDTDEEGATVPGNWHNNLISRICISTDAIDDATNVVLTQSELSRIFTELSHIDDKNIHVTVEDKNTWDAKATEDFVLQKIQDLIGDAPDVLDTLGELADALHDNPDIIDNILADLTEIKNNYIPRVGGKDHSMTGSLVVNASTWSIQDTDGNGLLINDSANVHLGRNGGTTHIRSGASDLFHTKSGANYRIWDESNLNPATVADLANYLKLSGGTMTGAIVMPNNVSIYGQSVGKGNYNIGVIDPSNNLQLGSVNLVTWINSKEGDLIHYRGNNKYKIWDAYNLPNPIDESDLSGYVKSYENANLGEYMNLNISRTGGWAGGYYLKHSGNTDNPNQFGVGYYGSGTTAQYAFLGIGDQSEYDKTNNLKVYTDHVTFGGKTIYHEGNLPAYPTWSTLSGKPNFATVATSGSYNDLSDKPTIPSIPGSLPNPYSLTFTGYQSKSYNGSAAVSVAIPSKVSQLSDSANYALRRDNNVFIANGNEFNFSLDNMTANGDIWINYRNGVGAASSYKVVNYRFGQGIASAAYANIYGNTLIGLTGLQVGSTADFGWYPYLDRISAGRSTARGVSVGSLLVSDHWADSSKVPDQGLYSKGDIITSGDMLFYEKIWSDTLAPNKSYSALIRVLNGDSAGGPTTYGTVLQINHRIAYWATQLWIDQTNNNSAAGKLRYRTSRYNSDEYSPWKVLATEDYVTSQVGNYLPLTGGTVTGQTTFQANANPLRVNGTNSNDVYLQVLHKGTARAAFGFIDTWGPYMYNYGTSKYLTVRSDGAYYGTPESSQKLLTSTDLSGYATQSWVEGKNYATKSDITNALSGYVKSTSTLKVSDIQVLAAGSTPGSTTGVLYIVLEA